MEPKIEIRGLVCGYGKCPVVNVPALEVRARETIALVGRSGGGKSTILATLAGALPRLGGRIAFDGTAVDADILRLKVARTLQAFPLLHWLTVGENLALAARIRGVEIDSIAATLSTFSAAHLEHKYPKELSGGERARASLAQAAASKPELLLLDEPLTGLDPVVRQEVAEALFGFAQNAQCAVVLVTHDLSEAVRLADRIIALRPSGSMSIADVMIDTAEDDAIARTTRALTGEGYTGGGVGNET